MEKLNFFLKEGKIPNIIFHGPPNSGKKTILNAFIQNIYKDKDIIQQQVMKVNCAYGKGIKFIREELKYFSKMNTHFLFKSILLLNAEKLTPDAQFALRRCIEEFSHNTRYFIVTTDKYRLIKPILSRFSEIYMCALPEILNTTPNENFPRIMQTLTPENILETAHTLYEHACSAMDLEKYVNERDMDLEEKYTWLMYYSKIKSEFNNETLLMYVLLHYLLFRKECSLKVFM
jgi:DNA polymerase III delta prime subunit